MQQKQAGEAIHIYCELIRSESSNKERGLAKQPQKPEGVSEAQNSYRAAPLQSKLQIDTSKRDSAQNKAAQTGVKENLKYPYDLVVKLLYGCGLRLFECLNLRIQSFNMIFLRLARFFRQFLKYVCPAFSAPGFRSGVTAGNKLTH